MNINTEQSIHALRLANDTRTSQHAFRREMAAVSYAEGCQRVARLLVGDDDMDDAIGRMRVGRFLNTIRRFGPLNIERSLNAAGIVSEERRVRDLTNRQRVALAGFIAPRMDDAEVAA